MPWALLLALCLAAAPPPQTVPPSPPAPPPAAGVLTVRDAGRNGQTYVLVLPPGYSAGRPWPILYLMDAGGRGRLAAERFAPGAARFGYVLASSNNSQANGPTQPNVDALNAMWDDTHARLSLDPRRAYIAGFSGCARFACSSARLLAGQIAGVIGCGAGFGSPDEPRRDLPFAYYGFVGDRDFNYSEMTGVSQKLRELGVPHGFHVFAGPHDWPPAEDAARALAWMELRAMSTGVRPTDPALVAALLAERRTEAQGLDAPGRELDALAGMAALAADFAGLADVAAEKERARALEKSPALKKARSDVARAARAEAGELRRVREVLGRVPAEDEAPRKAGRLAVELGLTDLQKRAAGGERAAQRILAELAIQTGFYLPRAARERDDNDTAAQMLGLATLISPERPGPWRSLAAVEARRRRRADALAALGRAVDAGLTGRSEVASDPDFEALRALPEFQALLARVPEAP